MNGSIISWLLLVISTISILSDVATASTSASAQCLGIEQRSLLLKLRNNLVFNPFASSKLVQWDRSADSWSGVTCEDGLVVGLDLSEEWISGGIGRSSSLFRLEFLRSLNLAFNDFNFLAIPSGLANLSRLVHLNLSNAGFDGQIPVELSRLTKLRTLDLSMLFLEMPSLRSLIGDLGELRELYLDWVNVSAEGSGWCDTLSSSVPKLEVLSMSRCSLSGPIKASLMSLANLSVIQLVGNNLNTTVPSFLANFSNLKILSLSYCSLQGEFPPEIFQVQTLQTLDVSFNELLRGSLPIFPENSSLQTLVLSDTSISGRLPDSIGNLRNLSRIELVDCSFDGNIPSSLTSLSRLSYLDLSFNNFTGPIDSTQWESLLSLLILDLRFNLLEGSIPSSLFTHPSIQQLLLTNNRFSGQLKGFFNASSHMLTTVDLSRNNIGGELPMSVWELQGLDYLSLSSNNFSGSFHINLVQQLRNLSHLDLSHNRFSIYVTNTAFQASSFPYLNYLNLASCQLMTLPQFLANQSTLLFLDLSRNYIKGYIPRWIWTLENLGHLNLSSNFFDHLETPLGNLTYAMDVVDLHSNMLRGNMPPLTLNAYYLDLSSNNINSVIMDDINLLNSMFFFSLSKNNFHGSIPKSICKADSLAVLDLSHNYLNGTIPDCLIMASLEVLNLRNNQLSGHIPQNIRATCNLSRLDLSENLLTGQIPLSLANCAMLEIVNIGDNQIDGTFPCHFKAMSSLRVLILRSNQLHGEIRCLHSPSTWKILQIIDLSSNDFGGTLPASLLTSWDAMKANVDFDHLHLSYFTQSDELYYEDTIRVTFKGLQLELVKILTIFTSIDFSSNRLEGLIPDTLGDLKALYFLNLSHNTIFGSIPSVLGSLDQLESLDLSWNYLNGTIPAELANLNFLSFLNLSNNQLVGSIPTGGQFLTFSKSSFEGNLGLCGLQLNKSCSTTTNGTKEAGSVPTQSDIDDDNNDDSKKWFYMGIPLGFAVGFWVFCGPIMFIRSWRFAYYRFWDKVLFKQS